MNAAAKIVIQGQEFVLKEKEWSGWKHVHFNLMPTQSVHGICLFYLKEVRPKFKLYVIAHPHRPGPASPCPSRRRNPTPRSSSGASAPTSPRAFRPTRARSITMSSTKRSSCHLDNMVYQESMAMLEYELGRFDDGLLFFYFSNADQRQHMFWRLIDPGHPAYDEKLAAAFGDVIARTYGEMDRALDLALRKADKDTVVLVLSDHGFNPFRRGFNLNTWLFQQGYHRLQKPWKQEESAFFDNTDWSKTRAYGMGLNSLYINEKGREGEGIVAPGADKDNLVREIARQARSLDRPEDRRARRSSRPSSPRIPIAGRTWRWPPTSSSASTAATGSRGNRPLAASPRRSSKTTTRNGAATTCRRPDILPGIAFCQPQVHGRRPGHPRPDGIDPRHLRCREAQGHDRPERPRISP